MNNDNRTLDIALKVFVVVGIVGVWVWGFML